MNGVQKKGRMALGRGLSALISSPVVPLNPKTEVKASSSPFDGSAAIVIEPMNDSIVSPSAGAGVKYMERSKVVPNPSQPRKTFDEQDLKELADSIKNMGVLQPVIVRPGKGSTEGKFEIVAGERRWRASELAGLTQIPVIIKELSDWESLEIALVENVQRANLNPIEEAEGYQKLMDQYSLSQQDVADRVGKDRATVANIIRIVKLAGEVQSLIRNGSISLGHAKALLSVKDPRAQISLAKKTVDEGLSVRALETLISQSAPLDGSKRAALHGLDVGISGAKRGITAFPEIVEKLRRKLGTKVMIRHQASGRGKIEIEYFSEAELTRVVDALCE